MKVLYFDCSMGVAGDMLVSTLLELTDNIDESLKELNELGIPNVTFEREDKIKSGIKGSYLTVKVNDEVEDEHMHSHHHHHGEEEHHHSHSNLHSISHIINDHLKVNDKVKKDILAVYQIIAEAESKVHNTTIDNIHFHEVGTMDAIADISATCFLIDKLKVDKIIASPIHVGKGTVKCAHGILPVPAPATALILKDIPIYSKEEINGELCTPTGAALLKHFVSEFKDMPIMKVNKIGYGMGKKDFTFLNALRSFLGEIDNKDNDTVVELSFNIDDMTGEEIGFLYDVLLEKAYDVFATPIFMKKNRPANLITVLCSNENKEDVIKLIFKHSSTLGIRESIKNRYILDRDIKEIETEYGIIRRKDSYGYGMNKSKYEYDDLSKIAKENNISIKEILKDIKDK